MSCVTVTKFCGKQCKTVPTVRKPALFRMTYVHHTNIVLSPMFTQNPIKENCTVKQKHPTPTGNPSTEF